MSLGRIPRRITKRVPYNGIYNKFTGGVVTQSEEARISPTAAREAVNLYQTQDGIYTTRPGTGTYGADLGAIPDGIGEYVSGAVTTLIAVAGGVAYSSTDGGSWTAISGATFTSGVTCFFLQIKSRLYITNGTDNLAYFDGTNLQQYTSRSAPAWGGTPLTRITLTSGNYTQYYQVTALNEVGETVGSTEQSITTNKVRDNWTGGEGITLAYVAVSGATRYQIYWADQTGFEVLIDSTTFTSYTDDGTKEANPYVEVPADNTTTAPKFKQMELSGNRIWATNDPNNLYRVYFSGTGQFMGTFSDFFGGGWVDLEKGGRDMPRAVCHYRTGKGDSVLTALCSSPEGRGSIWQLALETATVGDTTFTVPTTSKIIGSIGTSAPASVVKVGNDVVFYNKKGFTSLGSKANLLNILATDELSFNIRPNVRNLVGSQAANVCGYFFEGKIYWSVPESSSGNDRIYIFDTEHKNWQVSWTFGVKQFMEYTESSGTSILLGVPITGTKLIQISDNISGDLGSAFSTLYTSGLYSIDKDKTIAAKIKYAYVELGRPRGNITFTLLGTAKNKPYSQIGSVTISDFISQTGYSWDPFSSIQYSSGSGSPTTFSSSSRKRRIKVNKLLYNYQVQVSSSGLTDYWQLLSWQVKGKIIPVKDPSSWSQ